MKDWFEELWDEAEEYDLASLFEARFEPHSPQLVYLRMLWEFYGEELEAEAAAEGAPQIHLTSFQSDGLWRAKRILEERNGVLIADEVGLGKTFLAGELIREAVQDRRQRVLVITRPLCATGHGGRSSMSTCWRRSLCHTSSSWPTGVSTPSTRQT